MCATFLEYPGKCIYSNLTSSSFRTICIYGLNVYTVLQFAFPQIVKLTKSRRSCVSSYRYRSRFRFLAGPCGDFNCRGIVASEFVGNLADSKRISRTISIFMRVIHENFQRIYQISVEESRSYCLMWERTNWINCGSRNILNNILKENIVLCEFVGNFAKPHSHFVNPLPQCIVHSLYKLRQVREWNYDTPWT